MRFGDLRPSLDAVYGARDEARLVAGLARAMNDACGGSGVHVVSYDADPGAGTLRIREVANAGVSRSLARAFADTFVQLPREFVRGSLRMEAVTAKSNAERKASLVDAYLARARAGDLLSVNGWDAAGRGIFLAGHLPRATKLTPVERTALTRLAAHEVGALRLLDLREDPVAVVSSEGRTLEADARAGELPNAALERTARAIARLARAKRGGVPAGVGRVSPRVDADWTVVGRFVEDGAEHFLVRANRAPAAPLPELTARERQIVSLLDAGHHMKLVAYELGISYATVRVLAARARKKFARS